MLSRLLDWITGLDIAKAESRARLDAMKDRSLRLAQLRQLAMDAARKLDELRQGDHREPISAEIPAEDYDAIVKAQQELEWEMGVFRNPTPGGDKFLLDFIPCTRGQRYALTFA